MTFEDIKKSEMREKIFPAVLEEACRQWCAFIEDAPERKSGEGFADFFYEIFEEKEQEYVFAEYGKNQENAEERSSERGKESARR